MDLRDRFALTFGHRMRTNRPRTGSAPFTRIAAISVAHDVATTHAGGHGWFPPSDQVRRRHRAHRDQQVVSDRRRKRRSQGASGIAFEQPIARVYSGPAIKA
jgi:hypothetical protein